MSEFEIRLIEILLENKHRDLRWSDLWRIYCEKYELESKARFSRRVRVMRDLGFVTFEKADGRSFFIRLGSVTG